MPGGDGTGPLGLGPMTGRQAGYCAGYPVPGYMNPIPGVGRGFGYGWGRGRRGRGRGWRRGLGRRWNWFAYAYGNPYWGYPYTGEITPKEEAEALKEQATLMQEEVKALNERIKELESLTKKEKR